MNKPMRVLGLMSGTSADGIDAALVRVDGAPPDSHVVLEAHHHTPFRPFVRERILRLANGGQTTTAEIGELNFLIGEELARAVIESCRKWRVPLKTLSLIGSHGQTVYHLGAAVRFQGKVRIPSTLQLGDINVIVERTGVTTVGDFRPADMAAGGQGAPLIPFVDYMLYRDAKRGRAALNIGGIANVTVIPRGAKPRDIYAFDTGPGNMVIDALIQRITRGREAYDHGARMALGGRTIQELLLRLMREPYLRKKPPKSAGREQFGEGYASRLIAWGHRHHAEAADVVRTATVFTALSVADAFRRFILPRMTVDELVVTGGGAQNPLIMAQLAASLPGVEIVSASRFGVPPEAKEAFGFAVLAYETYHGRPSNVPSATGASHPVILGKIVRAQPHSSRRQD